MATKKKKSVVKMEYGWGNDSATPYSASATVDKVEMVGTSVGSYDEAKENLLSQIRTYLKGVASIPEPEEIDLDELVEKE